MSESAVTQDMESVLGSGDAAGELLLATDVYVCTVSFDDGLHMASVRYRSGLVV